MEPPNWCNIHLVLMNIAIPTIHLISPNSILNPIPLPFLPPLLPLLPFLLPPLAPLPPPSNNLFTLEFFIFLIHYTIQWLWKILKFRSIRNSYLGKRFKIILRTLVNNIIFQVTCWITFCTFMKTNLTPHSLLD